MGVGEQDDELSDVEDTLCQEDPILFSWPQKQNYIATPLRFCLFSICMKTRNRRNVGNNVFELYAYCVYKLSELFLGSHTETWVKESVGNLAKNSL